MFTLALLCNNILGKLGGIDSAKSPEYGCNIVTSLEAIYTCAYALREHLANAFDLLLIDAYFPLALYRHKTNTAILLLSLQCINVIKMRSASEKFLKLRVPQKFGWRSNILCTFTGLRKLKDRCNKCVDLRWEDFD